MVTLASVIALVDIFTFNTLLEMLDVKYGQRRDAPQDVCFQYSIRDANNGHV